MASQQENKGSVYPLIAVGLFIIIVFFFFLWKFQHDAFCIFWLKVGYYQIYPFAIIPELIGWDSAPPLTLAHGIVSAVSHLDELTPFRLFNLQLKVGLYYALLISPVLIKFAWEDRNHFLNKCQNTYLLWDLLHVQSRTNKCIIPVIRFEEKWLRKRKNRHPGLDRPMLPTEFAKANKGLVTNGILSASQAEKIFLSQVPQMLEKAVEKSGGKGGFKIIPFDLNKMPDYWKALAVIFATRIVERGEDGRKKAQKMQDDINNSTDVSKQNGNNVINCFEFKAASLFRELFRPDKLHPTIEEVRGKSLTTTTFLMHLLFEARKDGKLPTSQIIWLKMIDRTLFFALNSVTPELIARGWAEAAGPYAQYLSEISASSYGLKMKMIYVKNAIPAFEKRLFERGVIAERKYLSSEDAELLRAKIERKHQFEQQFEESGGRPQRPAKR